MAPNEKTCEKCGKLMESINIFGTPIYHCEQCDTERETEERKAREHESAIENKDRIERIIRDRTPEIYKNIKTIDFDNRLFERAFLIFGDFGTGKTYTAYSLAHSMMLDSTIKDFKVVRAFSMMMDIKASFSTGTYEAVVKKYEKLPLLVIDEWGKNSGTDFEEAVLFEIVNTRYENGKRTGIIVNAKRKEDLLTLIRPDVLDRFRRGIVEINGKSLR